MLVPNSQACDNQISSTTPIPASVTAAASQNAARLAAAVQNAQIASETLAISNPWEFWRGGLNLMKDVARSNLRFTGSNVGPLQLPGLPAASPAVTNAARYNRWGKPDVTGEYVRSGGSLLWAGRAGASRGRASRWNTRFPAGPGGHFFSATGQPLLGGPGAGGPGGNPGDARPGNCGAIDACNPRRYDATYEAADVVASDGMDGGPTVISTPPAAPKLTTDQPVNIIVQPPASQGAAAPVSLVPALSTPAPACRPPARTGNICLDIKRGAVLASQVPVSVLYRCSQLAYAGVAPSPCLTDNGPVAVSDADLMAVPQYLAGMGEWSDSIAKPGAIPAECTTSGGPGGAGSSVPWWLWVLAGAFVVAVASGDERSAGGKKRAA